jgi:hypothetical protein
MTTGLRVVVRLTDEQAESVLFALQTQLQEVLPFHDGNCEELELSPEHVAMLERGAEDLAVCGRVLRAAVDRVLPADDGVLEFFEACEAYWAKAIKDDRDGLPEDMAYDRAALEKIRAVALLVREANATTTEGRR